MRIEKFIEFFLSEWLTSFEALTQEISLRSDVCSVKTDGVLEVSCCHMSQCSMSNTNNLPAILTQWRSSLQNCNVLRSDLPRHPRRLISRNIEKIELSRSRQDSPLPLTSAGARHRALKTNVPAVRAQFVS